jgi:hypothetical protein
MTTKTLPHGWVKKYGCREFIADEPCTIPIILKVAEIASDLHAGLERFFKFFQRKRLAVRPREPILST